VLAALVEYTFSSYACFVSIFGELLGTENGWELQRQI